MENNSTLDSEVNEHNVTAHQQNISVTVNNDNVNDSISTISQIGSVTAELRLSSNYDEDSSTIQDEISEHSDNLFERHDNNNIEDVTFNDEIFVQAGNDAPNFDINHRIEDVAFSASSSSSDISDVFEGTQSTIEEQRFMINRNMYWDISDNESDQNSSDSDDSDEYDEMSNDSVNVDNLDFSKLRNMINDENENATLNNYFVINKLEMLLAVYKFGTKYALPNVAIADLCKMINSFVAEPILPQSRYKLDKLLNPKDNNTYHAMCPTCSTYLGTYDSSVRFKHCDVCEKNINLKEPSFNQFYVTSNVDSQVKHLLESDGEYYSKVISERESNETLQDFYDGRKYKEFIASLPPERRDCYATITFNSDGSPIFVSSSFSVWPIQLIINEMQPQIRNKKQIVCALWYGHQKPNMTYFLNTFVENMNIFSEDGIECQIKNQSQRIYFYTLCCCVDSVARAPMQGIKQFNGYYGCNWCMHPGKLVKHDKGKTIKYVLLDETPAQRTQENTLRYMIEATESRKPVYGIRKATPLINLNTFDVIEGFVPDPMHCIDLGITKQFCEYWLKPGTCPYSISNESIDVIDNLLISLKVPSRLARLSRSINLRKMWKAREWLNWTLFYSLPVLNNIPDFPKEYIEHWALLVEGYYILLTQSISDSQLKKADTLLRKFVAYTELLYGEDAMSFNVHQLSHLSVSAANWGPLWAHWGYPFESNNGKIVRTVHAAKGVLSQVCRRIAFNRSVAILEDHVKQKEDSPILSFCDYLENRCTKKTIKYGNIRYLGKKVPPSDNVCLHLNLIKSNCWEFKRFVKNECVYKSKLCLNCRSDNSYAVLQNNDFVQLERFILDVVNEKQYSVVRKINVRDCFNGISCMKEIINKSELHYIETNSIAKPCVVIETNKTHYIAPLPHEAWY